MTKVYYFGCVGSVGHYMHSNAPSLTLEERRAVSLFTRTNPWGFSIDGGFKGLQHKDGWTALAMDDFTIDDRPGSNSVFLAEGEFDEPQMIKLAYQHFPAVAKRIGL
jgi:hypothetical protein